MNLILLKPEYLENESRARCTGLTARHVYATLRAQPHDELRVGLINGRMGTARVVRSTMDVLELEDLTLQTPPPAALDLDLYLALPRPKLVPRVLLAATSLGVKKITFFNAVRVEKAYWSCEQLRPESTQAACWLGLEQARDTMLPEVRLERLFKPFVEDRAPFLVRDRLALVAHPRAETACPFNAPEPVSLAIGPEGGFIPYELDLLERAGFRRVRSLERILRVETALSSLIGRLK